MPYSGGEEADGISLPTLADHLFRFDAPALRRELELFRIKYESEFGETDLTRRYTSTWPSGQQAWLMEHEPKRYWDGLPPFVQVFLKEKMRLAHRGGNLDDMPSKLLQLYLEGKMRIDGNGPVR